MISKISNIKELTQKPEWSEVIKLYSGLFDDKNERTEFIIDLSENEISLAADCKNESISSESELKNSLTETSFQKALYFNDSYGSAKAFEALLKLEGQTQVSEILASIRTPLKIHKQSIQEFVLRSSKDELLVFLANVIKNDNKQNKNILNWCFQVISSRTFSQVQDNTEQIESIIDHLKYVKNRSELLKTLYIANFLLVFKIKHLERVAYEISKMLLQKKAVDKTQYKIAGRLIDLYDLNKSKINAKANLETRYDLSERSRISNSNKIKESILNQTFRCKLKKLTKALDGKLNYIPVTILGIPKHPRGNQLIPLSELSKLRNYKSGDIILAKVVDVKYGQGYITLIPVIAEILND